MMYFQDPALLEFQRRWEEEEGVSNLQKIFGLKHTPCDSQFRDILDRTDSVYLEQTFQDFFKRLQRGKYLEEYEFIYGKYLIPIDGSDYFSSEKINCPGCLRQSSSKTIHYRHQILQSVIVHPDKKQVFPLAPEAIRNFDGTEKQDCEINAAKRMLLKTRENHPKLGIIITGDGLYSKQPFIESVKNEGMSYILVAKPDDHQILFRNIEIRRQSGQLHELEIVDAKQNLHIYRWTNGIELNGNMNTLRVNYFEYELFNNVKDKITYKNSWVSDIAISSDNVAQMTRGGRARWKIENETFNTLKNQGYHLEHNFGHGSQNLSMNFFLLNLLAFYMHQIFELTDKLYQRARAKFGARLEYWNQLRCTFRIMIFESWEDLLLRIGKRRQPPPDVS